MIVMFSLGPMINPSQPRRMLVGVYSKELGPLMIQALKLKGVTHAWVVNGANGLDEVNFFIHSE
jgi:anthranilate phosphoribosyltransferase